MASYDVPTGGKRDAAIQFDHPESSATVVEKLAVQAAFNLSTGEL